MEMKKILIIGSPGSGKSIFAKELSKKIDIPVTHLDLLWHKADKSTVTDAEFDRKLAETMQKSEWILDGTYSRTLRQRLERCDTVFLFDLPTDVCIEGIKARVGVKRDDLPWLESELDEEFLAYTKMYRTGKLPIIKSMLEDYTDNKNIIVFNSRNEVNNFLKTL